MRTNHPLTCRLGARSPDTGLFTVGERVRIDCVDRTLVEIAGRSKSHRTSVTGTIKAHDGNSITIDGQHDVTCKLDDDSPGLDGHKLGELVTVNCLHGVLVTLAKTSDTPTTAGISGTVTALSSTSITVHDGDRDLTCTIGSSSPGLGDVKLGDHLKIGCLNGVLDSVGRWTARTGAELGTASLGLTLAIL